MPGVLAGLRRTDPLSSPDTQYTSPARLQPSAPPRPQVARQGGPLGDGLEAPSPHRLGGASAIEQSTTELAGASGGTARHFPLFPTGPPSQT